jgi:hypothetical protein
MEVLSLRAELFDVNCRRDLKKLRGIVAFRDFVNSPKKTLS